MKITNETDYDTRYLRRLFMAVEKYAEKWQMARKDDYKYRRITVKYCRGERIHGLAWVNTYSIVMKLPRPKFPKAFGARDDRYVSSQTVAGVYLHEIEHNSGKRHQEMADWGKRKIDFWPEETISVKPKKVKPKISAVEKREANARKKLDEWQKKMKRAKTFVRKYQAKVRYYDKKKAASNRS